MKYKPEEFKKRSMFWINANAFLGTLFATGVMVFLLLILAVAIKWAVTYLF